MEITGTLINYYVHCKRQCYLFGNKINLEDNEELVRIGKAIHEMKLSEGKNTEIALDSVKIDKLTKEYLTEIKKSDADVEAATWQLYYYLYILKKYGIERKGKLEFHEKKTGVKTTILELTDEIEAKLETMIQEIKEFLESDELPVEKLNIAKCKKCAYYSYCYI